MKITKVVAILLAALSVSACAGHRVNESRFIAANYAAGDALVRQVITRVKPGQPILVATMVNVDDLDHSSTLGRLASEQISARFFHKPVTTSSKCACGTTSISSAVKESCC